MNVLIVLSDLLRPWIVATALSVGGAALAAFAAALWWALGGRER